MAASLFNFSTYSRFNLSETESDIQVFVREYGYRIKKQLAREEEGGRSNFVSFAEKRLSITDLTWLHDNQERFFKDTPNENLLSLNYLSQIGFICSMIYSTDGKFLIVGHSTGLIQMRHGSTGVVLCTLRNIQFPPKPVYALQYSRLEERVCYAACNDGAVYRIEIPNMDSSLDDPPEYCIKADPALECLNTQYYGSPGISSYATPFITQRSAALALGLMADQSKMAVGYSDTSIKVYDMETVETITMYKVQKVRLQLIPKKLQRMHSGQVCALRCHDQNTNLFASGAWDKTLRIWDVRCKVGCVMTFEGVNICADSIDLNFNRKGKYGIIGGSGTNCVEIINLHNRYIACSYPAPGTVLAITSHNDKIAFGGTAPVLNIVSFHDPKHEECKVESETEYDYTVKDPTWDDKSMTEALESTSQAKSTISNITRSLDRGAISTINQQATPPPSC
ncbi:uncharacterized protein LOC123880700 isoform X3 [Maniola jurtina]|uniref:uncharacterized protein LOC123880700 isoform X3 n=1 Tax=Maniola jurtina TaxID=191418 RepID=UPI001E68B567|nr:uncharacterized protein LOC123880700 isoform X3 [Maniola jurtina]